MVKIERYGKVLVTVAEIRIWIEKQFVQDIDKKFEIKHFSNASLDTRKYIN